MFDCKQDIGLLQGSLLSVAYSNSGSLFDSAEWEKAVNIVHDSVKLIIHHALNDIKDEKKRIESRLHYNERLHAAIFFTTLSSHGIKSDAAEDFYNSILYNWPSMDLKFYLILNFKCDWSEYFIKNALQLPSETLFKVLKMVLDIPLPYYVKYYSWHLVLQTVILKLFKVGYEDEVKYPFDFNFTDSVPGVTNQLDNELIKKNEESCKKGNENNDSHDIGKECDVACENSKIAVEGNEMADKSQTFCENDTAIHQREDVFSENGTKTIENGTMISKSDNEIADKSVGNAENDHLLLHEPDLTSSFKELFTDLCDCMDMVLKKQNEIDVLKILLHAVKTCLKCLIIEKRKGNINKLQCSDFTRICHLLHGFIQSSAKHDELKVTLLKHSNKFLSHAYATVSWNISINYLIFLIKCHLNEIFPSFPTHLSSDAGDIDMGYLANTLDCLNSSFLKLDEHLKLLCKVVKFDFQGSSYAAITFLSDPSLMERDDILNVLKENCQVINISSVYSLVIDCIKTVKSQESKLKLLKIFYELLSKSEIKLYNTVLGYILSNYGYTNEFQLPDFNDQLSQFARKTPSLKEAEEVLPALLVQNPVIVLKYLVDQAVVQGSEGKVFIQVLKHFQHICFYKKNVDSLCTLHEILMDYFGERKLEAYESSNLVALCKVLVEVHSETPILYPCCFFKRCIVPKLQPDDNKIELILECAFVLLPALLSDDCFLEDSEFLQLFVLSFGMLVHHFIALENGKRKSLVIPILKEFESFQLKCRQMKDEQKVDLWSTFKDTSEMACVYIKEFLPADIEFVSNSYIWTWCCKNEDSLFFEEKFPFEMITYASLVNILIEVLPTLTKEEWLYSMNLIKICCKNDRLRDEITCSTNLLKLSGSGLDSQVTLLPVLNSLHFILNDNIDRSFYVSSCFSTSLINLLDQEEAAHTFLLLFTFLELCYLISRVSPDLIPIYNATLLELRKLIIESCSVESDQNYCVKIMSDAIVCLPDTSAKSFLLQNMK